MTISTPSPRGARRRNNGRHQGAARQVRPFEQPIQNRITPVAPTEATAPIDYPTDFLELGVPEDLIKVLAARGVTTAFPIQAATLPDSLKGHDVLGRGKTGSGKTIAFALPLVARLAASGLRRQAGHPRGLILVPTRELANQVMTSLQPLAAALSLRVVTIYGGVGQGPQVSALRQGVDIVVACPGRLEDLMGQRHCRLDAVEITVLDEADHMADLGFLPGVKRILDATPAGGQRMLFSATLDKAIDGLVRTYLVNPVVHSVDPEVSSINTMTHHVLAVTAADKPSIVSALASVSIARCCSRVPSTAPRSSPSSCVRPASPPSNCTATCRRVPASATSPTSAPVSVRVLVATDIAARGIHVDDIALVVHVDPPAEHKAFLHRSGRTARAGADGIVVTVMTPDQTGDVRSLARAAGITPTVTTVNSAHPLLGELSGPLAPKVAARPQTTDDSINAPRQRPSQPGRRRTQAGGRSGSSAGQQRRTGRGSGGRRSATTGR